MDIFKYKEKLKNEQLDPKFIKRYDVFYDLVELQRETNNIIIDFIITNKLKNHDYSYLENNTIKFISGEIEVFYSTYRITEDSTFFNVEVNYDETEVIFNGYRTKRASSQSILPNSTIVNPKTYTLDDDLEETKKSIPDHIFEVEVPMEILVHYFNIEMETALSELVKNIRWLIDSSRSEDTKDMINKYLIELKNEVIGNNLKQED